LKWINNYLPAIVWFIVILILIGIPGNYIPPINPLAEILSIDKVVHFIIFGIFVALTMLGSYRQYKVGVRSKYTVYALFVGVLAGGLTEILQETIFIGRYGSVWDFLADAIGCGIGVLIFFVYNKKNKEV